MELITIKIINELTVLNIPYIFLIIKFINYYFNRTNIIHRDENPQFLIGTYD
jgi:hypothetical protein